MISHPDIHTLTNTLRFISYELYSHSQSFKNIEESGLGGGTVNKALDSQARRPEFNPWQRISDVWFFLCISYPYAFVYMILWFMVLTSINIPALKDKLKVNSPEVPF